MPIDGVSLYRMQSCCGAHLDDMCTAVVQEHERSLKLARKPNGFGYIGLGAKLLSLHGQFPVVSDMTQDIAAVVNTTMHCAEEKAVDRKAHLEDVAKLANELQPTGSSLATANVQTKVYLITERDFHICSDMYRKILLTICARQCQVHVEPACQVTSAESLIGLGYKHVQLCPHAS